jgi:bacterial/archaeal transporter family protein
METNSNIWWIYALLSAFFAALTTIFAKVGVQNIDSNLANAIRTVVIVVIAWGLVVAENNLDKLPEISGRALIFLIISGIATGLSWLFYFKALQVGKASQVAPIDKSSTILVILFSIVFLQEPLSLKTILGGVLISIGTLVLVLG